MATPSPTIRARKPRFNESMSSMTVPVARAIVRAGSGAE